MAETGTLTPQQPVGSSVYEGGGEKRTYWSLQPLGWLATAEFSSGFGTPEVSSASVIGFRGVRDSEKTRYILQMMQPNLLDDRITV